MNVPILLLLTALVMPTAASAVEDTVGLRAVEVTSSWVETDPHVLPTTTITTADLQRLHPVTAAEALRSVPGLYVSDHGGLGGLRTVSIRGGSAAQSLVLVDGFRWNSAQNGGADLGWVPASMLGTINVERGASSARYGANAMTGTVDLVLATPTSTMLQATSDLASFDTWRVAASGSAVDDDVAISAAVEHYTSAGTYGYNVTIDGQPGELLRENADVAATSGLLKLNAGPITMTTMLRSSDRGVPGAVVDGAVTQPRARLDDADVWSIISARILTDPASNLTARIGGRYLDQHYQDPDATFTGLDGIDARYLLRDATADLIWTSTSSAVLQKATLSAGYVDLRGEQLDPSVGGLAVRRTMAAAYDLQWSPTEVMFLDAAARFDAYSDVGNALSGALGLRWNVASDVTLRTSIGTGFRPPSFNELYFLNYGNTNLQPERSIMASVGGLWSPRSWLSLDANLFASRITDLIVSVPMSPVVTSAQNVGNAVSYGLELAARYSLLDNYLFGQWSYTLQRVEDRTGRSGIDGTLIPYVPMELIAWQTWWDDGRTVASLEWNYTSYRYAQPGAESTSLLAPYHVVSVSAGQVIRARDVVATIMLRIDNLLDERYVVIRGYPMPGRMLRLTLSVHS